MSAVHPALAAGGSAAVFTVTTFKNYAAAEKAKSTHTLASLAARISAETAASKATLPWLKLARFGDTRSDKNSLRHDANVVAVTGIEADYDGGKMPFAEALAILEKPGIAAILYTSPSHTEDAPRWRVLCPTSAELPPDRRRPLLGRLNGLFGGIFSRESWTLSQSYFYGSVRHNPSHEVAVIDGSPIDHHDDLDRIWIGPSNTPAAAAHTPRPSTGDEREFAELVQRILAGAEYHTALCPLAARLIGRSVPPGTVAELLRGVMLARPAEAQDARWRTRFDEIERLVASAAAKYAAPGEQRRENARALARLACRLVKSRVPEANVLRRLGTANAGAATPLPAEEISRIATWAARAAGAAHATR